MRVRGDEFRRMVVSGRVATSPKPSPEAWAQLRLRYRLAAMTADVWHDAVPFYRSLGWAPPDVVLLRRRLVP